MAKKVQAQDLNERIEVPMGEETLHFTVKPDDYIDYINEMSLDNKYNPAFNFLMATVDDESKDAVRALVRKPPVTIELFAKVFEQYGEDSNLGKAVKKPNSAPEQ